MSEEIAEAPPPLDDAELARIVRIVRATLAAEAPAGQATGLQRALDVCQKYWLMVGVLASLLLLTGAAIWFQADPFYKFREVAVAGEKAKAEQDKIAFDRGMAERWVALGNRFLDVWNLKEAAGAFDEALKFDATNLEAARGKLEAQIFQVPVGGRWDPEVIAQRIAVVEAQASGADSTSEKNPYALAALADLYGLYMGDWVKAKKLYEEALARRPQLAHAQLGSGIAAMQEGRWADAERAFARAVEISPLNPLYRSDHASALVHLGRTEDALSEFTEVSKLDPDLPLPYVERARILFRFAVGGDLGVAIKLFTHVQEMLARGTIATAEDERGPWQFETPEGVWVLDTVAEKRAFVGLALAILRFARNDTAAGANEARAALALVEGENTHALASLVRSDLSALEAARPDLAPRLYRFRSLPEAQVLLSAAASG